MLSWIAVVSSVSVLAAATGGYALLMRYDGNINRLGGLMGLPGVDRPEEGPKGSRNLLIVGSDTRAGLAPGVAGTVDGERADTIILAHLYGDGEQAELVSLPRDLYVEIPEHVDADTGRRVPAEERRINHSLYAGGPALLVATVERLTGIRVDHFIQVDFAGFLALVDTLGGVEVCLSEPAKERDSKIDLPAGRQVIEGDQALAFVRQRKGLPRGDLDRIRRQQQFIGAIVRKSLATDTLLNPFKLNGLLDVASRSVTVDDGTSLGDLRDLALRMRGFSAGGVVFTTAPTVEEPARRGGASVLLLDDVEAGQLFQRLRDDRPPGAPAPPPDQVEKPEPLIVAPSRVSVAVLNGTGRTGLAREAAAELEAVGFQLAGVPGNRGTGARQTVVRHGPDRADSARTLAAAVPGAVVELDPGLSRTVELVLGSSYSGVQRVDVGGGAAPSRPAVSSPEAEKPPLVTAKDDPCAP